MTGKRIIYYILAAFIAGNLLLIYIQYNSAKNTNNLIKGNEKLLRGFRVSSELKELEKDVIYVESKIRGTVSTKDSSYIEGLETKIVEVEADLDQLQKITDDDNSIRYIDELDLLVKEKLLFNSKILDSFHLAGKNAAENVIVPTGTTVLVPTGIAFQIPEGFEIQVRPRSGLSLKTGLIVKNSPGTVDQDYSGECSVIMHNLGIDLYQINAGDRIAQAVLVPVEIPELEEVLDFDTETERGTKGFGSTGK